MYVNFLHRKTGKASQAKFGQIPLLKIKQLTASAVSDIKNRYFISVIAESHKDIEFIYRHFNGMPTPPTISKKAIWTGDLAAFIILNYPDKFEDEFND